MIDAHGKNVLLRAEFEQGRQNAFEARIPVRPAAHEVAVDPDIGVVIHPIEFDGDEFVRIGGVELEVFAIPPDAAWGVAITAALLSAKRPLTAPVVRHLDLTPGGVIEAGRHRRGEVAFAEAPVFVEVHHRSRGRRWHGDRAHGSGAKRRGNPQEQRADTDRAQEPGA